MTVKKVDSTEPDGMEQVFKLFGEDHVRARIEGWRRMDPEAADIFTRLTYEGLYARTVLEPKVRQLCTVSGLTVLNALPSLKTHITAALRVGATEVEVREAIFQMATYCGIPYMNQALKTLDEVVQEQKKQHE